jgi:hypothetical protein
MIKVSGVRFQMAEVRKQMTDLRFRFSVIHRATRNAKLVTRILTPEH